jgi:(p)ppGpp synthase/HD superfamily hydrolase
MRTIAPRSQHVETSTPMTPFAERPRKLVLEGRGPESKRHLSSMYQMQWANLACCIRELKAMCAARGFEASYFGRIKSFRSMCEKMRRQAIGFDSVIDAIGARVVVRDERQCYQLLKDIRTRYATHKGGDRDYIVAPKSNGYQSIHVSLVSAEGWRVEVQIRTYSMDLFAESGGAAHREYKDPGSERPQWLGLRGPAATP